MIKRGATGVYHVCAEAHLHRHLAEFDFHDTSRTAVGYTDARRIDDALAPQRSADW